LVTVSFSFAGDAQNGAGRALAEAAKIGGDPDKNVDLFAARSAGAI
jgi:hypothetical protein